MLNNVVITKRRHPSSSQNIANRNIFLPVWTQVFKFIPAMGAAITLLFFILILVDSQFHSSLLQNWSAARELQEYAASPLVNENDSKHSWCLLYDKAPRTGSTTIARSLAKCWKSISNIHVTIRKGRFSTAIPMLLETPYRKVVALVGSHFSISGEDILSIKSKCENVLYVTSTRCMYERLWSEAKYIVSEADIRHNSSLAAENIPHAWTTLFKRLSKSEPYFENYPFISSYDDVENIVPGRNGNLLVPAYVIRTEYMQDDLSLLLRAFECGENDIQATNIHTVDLQNNLDLSFGSADIGTHNNPKNLSDISLRYGDFRHKYLSRLAKAVNANGLAMARKVMRAT